MFITEWAAKWGVSPEALADLRSQLLGDQFEPKVMSGRSESAVQSTVRLNARKRGVILWRNNVGVAQDQAGNPIRFGLCNESQKVNKNTKSSDLIGITPIEIHPRHVGTTFGVFTAVECKHGSWNPRKKLDSHELAQLKYLEIVRANGGIGFFANSGVMYES